MSSPRGKFIIIEGPDGSGKTTCSKLLVDKLNEMDIITKWTHEPGGVIGDEFSETMRNMLKHHKFSSEVESLLFAASQRYTLDNFIIPALKENHSIVCDRFTRSIEIYQNYYKALYNKTIDNSNLELDFINLVKHIYGIYNQEIFLTPDIEFILQIDYNIALERITSRGINTQEVRESDTNALKDVINAYNMEETLSDIIPFRPSKIYKMDVANLSPDEVVNQMLSKILDKYDDKYKL